MIIPDIRAAIDLGTVTSRLLVASIDKGVVLPLARRSVITHMGEGLAESGRICDAAADRVLQAILQFKESITVVAAELRAAGLECPRIPVRAVATSAMRDASNSAEIIALLAEQGISVEVIAGAREAELSFKGTLSGFPRESNEHAEPAIEPSVSSIMTIDVGGGSTEVIFGRYDDDAVSHPNLLIEKAISFNIGSRRVTDRFLHSDPPTVDELAAARAWIEAEIKPFFYDCPKTPRVIYAVAGVATTAVSILEEMREYDRDRVHGTTISTEVFDRMLARLAAMPLAARREVVGLHPQRASVIVGGCITLSCMLHAVQADDFIVSETDILNGILLV